MHRLSKKNAAQKRLRSTLCRVQGRVKIMEKSASWPKVKRLGNSLQKDPKSAPHHRKSETFVMQLERKKKKGVRLVKKTGECTILMEQAVATRRGRGNVGAKQADGSGERVH